MRLRICRRLQGSIEGVAIDHFSVGLVYEMGTQLARADIHRRGSRGRARGDVECRRCD